MAQARLKVVIHASIGRKGVREFPTAAVQSFAFETAMDNDADAFQVAVGDPQRKLAFCTDRDNEVRVTVFDADFRGQIVPVFAGIADLATYTTADSTLAISGRDNSALAMSDAPPGRWRHKEPGKFIAARAIKLGMTMNRYHKMAEMGTIYTDGSESEWAFWYRLARSRGMFMWTEPLGGLVIDHLGYSLSPAYYFGRPQSGTSPSGWMMPDEVEISSSKQRQGEVWVYHQDSKTGVANIARAVDTSIRSWRKKPVKIISSSTAKNQKDAQDEADREIFESIVGAEEITVTINHTGRLIKQNEMARLNLPELELVGNYFVVGVRASVGESGRTQVVRLREKNFALSKRVPDPPKITTEDAGRGVTTSSVSGYVTSQGVRWGEMFVRATQEFGVPAGWDTAVFLGVLLSICKQESGFANVRQGSHTEWVPFSQYGTPHQNIDAYHAEFANEPKNPLNTAVPHGDAGVGPMQLTSQGYKDWADNYGWQGKAKVDEYEGGRWNPNSNIRAAARALVEKGNVAPKADPTTADNIWIAVARYHGSTSAQNNAAYVASVKGYYKSDYQGIAEGAITSGDKKNVGTERTYTTPNHGQVVLGENTPDEVVKAINFCMNRRGDAYKYGGHGPLYDCSSLVTAAYASASQRLRNLLSEPSDSSHGETTYTLFSKGRFDSIDHDNLMPGDLVFFHGNPPEHVGMYVDNGLMVHDPHTGDVVKVSSITSEYYTQNYSGARRLVQWRVQSERQSGN